MAKLRTVFRCQGCGQASPKWAGQCPGCGEWNTMVEEVEEVLSKAASKSRSLTNFTSEPVKLSEAGAMDAAHSPTGVAELDRVLGGGLVPGQIMLLAGPPGIGKSTLMLELCRAIAAGSLAGKKILYVSGEESLGQVGSRAKRLGAKADTVYLLSETNLAAILEHFHKLKPALLILDSIQTVFHPDFAGSAGSVGQIRECASEILRVAKSAGVPAFLLGHITKEGSLAGPKVLEHIVDTVLYFDMERAQVHRILRSHKNRFGPISEIGVFEMGESGLKSVDDASGLMYDAERSRPMAGRAFSVAFEGSRPMLAEVQALVSRSYYPYPKRMVTGMDSNRAQVLTSAAEKNLGLRLDDQDIFSTVQGGFKIKDTALDLAFVAALISSARDIELPPDWVFFGEVGILGQVASVSSLAKRVNEADRLGFKKAFVPPARKDPPKTRKMELVHVADIGELYAAVSKLKPAQNRAAAAKGDSK